MTAPLWVPPPERVARSHMSAFLRARGMRSYPEGYAWSVLHPEQFWPAVWRYSGVIADGEDGRGWTEVVRGLDRMAPPHPELGPRWFLGARLNFAENLLRFRDDNDAIVAWDESGRTRALSFSELYLEVARVAAGLRARGIRKGDRVAAFMPNVPEAVIAMLATASIGAIWSSCSPDFGTQAVLDRFGQIEPRVLFCAPGYVYNGKELDCLDRVREVAARIASIEHVVVAGDPGTTNVRGAIRWKDFRDEDATEVAFERLPFDHPLYVLYSSGTTGLPKCIVHGAGGTLLQHCKELLLHTDLRRDDRVFYHTTLGWMMWNWLASALATGSTIVLYDGAPFPRRADFLWEMADRERITVFGTSARYLAMCRKNGMTPGKDHDLSSLRTVLSTGSPLAADSFDYVYREVSPDVHLASISGGTDIVSCFAGGNPTAPVYRGEIQCRGLGMAVHVFDGEGRAVVGEPGELVCTRPFVSMPVAFWNDADGAKYRAAYFDRYPGVWRHGDWCEITPNDGLVIYGRSDATLNPGGVRIGTAEIYRQVEQLPEIVESVAIGREIEGSDVGDVEIVLYVRLRDGIDLDDALRERIRKQIRDNASPLHMPKAIHQVADIPRTLSGKISEIAVREAVHRRPVTNMEALANPDSLKYFA